MENKSFDELLKKYRQGKLSEGEKEYVEKEIKKAELIQDFLFEKEEVSSDFELEKSSEISTKEIHKSVRKKTRKQSAIIIGIIFTVLIIMSILVPAIVNSYYFNLLEGQKEGEISKYEFQQRVQNDIHPSSLHLLGVVAEKTGVAKYSVSKSYGDAFTNQIYNSLYTINKGKIKMIQSNYDFEKIMYQEMVSNQPKLGENESNKLLEQQLEKAKQLPESSWIKVNLIMKEPTSIAEVQSLLKDHNIKNPLFGSIYTSDEQEHFNTGEFGFIYNSLGSYPSKISKTEKNYPAIIVNKKITSQTEPALIEKHFKSSLIYLLDKSKEESGLHGNTKEEMKIDIEYNQRMKSALKYVNNNGVKVSSITVAIKPAMLKELLVDEKIGASSIMDALLYAPYFDRVLFY